MRNGSRIRGYTKRVISIGRMGTGPGGWIDVAAFLGDQQILSNIRKDLKSFYSKLKKSNDAPAAAVGYGMEGNIIGSALTPFFLRENLRYLYCPSVHRGEMFTQEEKTLWNKTVTIRTAMFLFDFVPSDGYMKEILESDDTWRNLKRVFIFAVFLTDPKGDYTDKITVRFFPGTDTDEEHTVLLDRHAVCSFPVERCSADLSNCLVCQKNMAEIFRV